MGLGLVECFFGKIKNYQRILIRYDKTSIAEAIGFLTI
jgi:hypothetical protein